MTSDDPWHIKGVRREARQSAREAARRAGMSVGAWLDNVILDSALDEGVGSARLAPLQYDPYDDQSTVRSESAREQPSARERHRDQNGDWRDGAGPRHRPSADYGLRP